MRCDIYTSLGAKGLILLQCCIFNTAINIFIAVQSLILLQGVHLLHKAIRTKF